MARAIIVLLWLLVKCNTQSTKSKKKNIGSCREAPVDTGIWRFLSSKFNYNFPAIIISGTGDCYLTSAGGTLLASLRPLLVCVCSNPVKYSDPNLRASASLALAKFMLVRYVTGLGPNHFQLLFFRHNQGFQN